MSVFLSARLRYLGICIQRSRFVVFLHPDINVAFIHSQAILESQLQPTMKSALSFSLIGLTAIISVSKAQGNYPNCTVFEWDEKPGYLQNGTVQRISPAATCEPASNQTHVCPIVADGDAQVGFRYNISSTLPNAYWNGPNGPVNYLHSLILPSVNSSLDGIGWPRSAIGAIDTTQALEPGTSGYINFTPYLRCFVGTMSNCTGEIADGVAIEACAPVIQTVDDSVTMLEGVFSVEEVPEDEVNQYRDPYANQVSNDARSSVPHHSNMAILAATLALIAASISQ